MLIIHQFQNVAQKYGKAKYSSLTFVCWGGEGGASAKAVFVSYDIMICAMCCSIYWLCMLLLFDFRTLLMVWYFLDCQLLMLITYFTGVDFSSQILIIMILICGICPLYIIWPDMYDSLPLFVVLCFKTRTS
jgi:hypothetical protein